MTKYKIVYSLSRRVKKVEIWAASPMLAFKKFKEMMPKVVFSNLAVNEVQEVSDVTEEVVGTRQPRNLCSPCVFEKIA